MVPRRRFPTPRWRLGWVIVACIAGMGPTHAASIRVATFNVRNYLSMDRIVDGGWRPDFPKPESEKAGTRKTIHAIAAHVLALQEMGTAPYLEELRQDLAREGLDYPYRHLLVAADPDRHVAVLSQLPFKRVTEHSSVSFTYFDRIEQVKRGMLEVTFDSPAGEWTLFVVHLKSRYTDRPDDPMSARRRLGEALQLREIILQRFPDPSGSRFAVVGDFNDTTESAPLARFLKRGATEITFALPAADSRGETWTHRYERADTYSRVDFLLLSPGLRPYAVRQTGTVFDGESSLRGTDHRPVYFDLDWTSGP